MIETMMRLWHREREPHAHRWQEEPWDSNQTSAGAERIEHMRAPEAVVFRVDVGDYG
jgi:hypothetical protein